MRGATLKNTVTSAKHKPAGGIAMPHRLTRNAWKIPACSPPGVNALTKLRGTVPKLTKFLSDVVESSAVLTRASMLQSSLPLWNASAQNEGRVCQFLPIRIKNRLPWQRPLSDREKKVGLIIPTHICAYPEDLVKVGPVHFDIISL